MLVLSYGLGSLVAGRNSVGPLRGAGWGHSLASAGLVFEAALLPLESQFMAEGQRVGYPWECTGLPARARCASPSASF